MKKALLILVLISSSSALAGPNSIMGAKPMPSGNAHHVGVGWPSVFYEYWRAGEPDWGIGGEIVYGDWSGEFSDVEVGAALNVPMRWHLKHSGNVDTAFLFKPGALIAGTDGGPGSDRFVFGARGEMGVPVSIDLEDKVNLITGGVAPVSFYIIENGDPFIVVPLLARLGAEVEATREITPFFMFELGPAFAFGDFGSEVEFAFRVWLGTTFW